MLQEAVKVLYHLHKSNAHPSHVVLLLAHTERFAEYLKREVYRQYFLQDFLHEDTRKAFLENWLVYGGVETFSPIRLRGKRVHSFIDHAVFEQIPFHVITYCEHFGKVFEALKYVECTCDIAKGA